MQRKIINIFFLVIYLNISFNYFIPLLNHEIFSDYIVNFLCVQKDEPENICMGNCLLAQQLKEQMENESKENQKSQPQPVNEQNPHFNTRIELNFSSYSSTIEFPKQSFSQIQKVIETNIPPPKFC